MIVPTLIALPLFVVSSSLAEDHSQWTGLALAEGDDDTASRSGASSDSSSKGGGKGVHDRSAMMEAIRVVEAIGIKSTWWYRDGEFFRLIEELP